ncbi:MAG: NAD(+) synthase [Candidatus Hydrogenedentes bacterium]|nr:NAD(+) synthase [Candidatus Hydrogenedentota bacterium]
MRLVKIGVAAVSVKVGDFQGNAERLCAVIGRAQEKGVHLLVTPELCVSGYSLEDRIWWPDIARRSWDSLQSIAGRCEGISVFLGLPIRMNSLMYNAAALVHDRETRGLVLKKFLPTYNIFYEGRNWTAWSNGVTQHQGVPAGDLVFDLPYGKVSAEVCEDLWAPESPARARVRAGAEIICNISASPFTPRKNESRKRLVQGAAAGMSCVYAFANVLGLDNCRLVFDGGGIIAKPERIVAAGEILSKEPWTLTTATVDLDEISRERAENSSWRSSVSNQNDCTATMVHVPGLYTPAPLRNYVAQMPASFFETDAAPPNAKTEAERFLDELFDGLALGLRDYFEKVLAFDRFLIALSGGRDSALCLLIAAEAAKSMRGAGETDLASRINTVYLPNGAYSTSATHDAARSLAEELGVSFQVVSIAEEAEIALAKAAELVGGAEHVTDLAKQNLQARVRGAMMLNWGNNTNALLLVTSNLSEAAVGYTTTGGDNQGGYSPIANLPKTLVTRLLAYLAERDGIQALRQVLDIPPSAELAPDQEDEADLMPYAILDDLLYLFARRRMALPDCWRVLCHRHEENDPEELRVWTSKFGRLFVQSQWKREQLPASLKVLDLDLDPKTGFRFPVTQSIHDELDELAKANLG